jgi:hypothetical protein
LKGGVEKTCTDSTFRGTVVVNNSTHAEVVLSSLTYSNCTQDANVITPGRLTIDDKGTVFIKERREETMVTSLGITCFYGAETGSIDIGTLTGGTTATLDVSTTELQREAGSNTTFCASKGTLTGSYWITTPDTLLIT